MKNSTFKISTRDIVEIAMLVAMAVVVHLINIETGLAGGSISFTMVPLLVLSYRLGWFKGFIGAGVVYGLIACILSMSFDNDGTTIVNYPFDYLLGWGAMAIAGLFRKPLFDDNSKLNNLQKICLLVISVLLACVGRFAGAMLSSIIVYSYDFSAAFIYNVSYVFISGIACAIVMVILYNPLVRINRRFPTERKTIEK